MAAPFSISGQPFLELRADASPPLAQRRRVRPRHVSRPSGALRPRARASVRAAAWAAMASANRGAEFRFTTREMVGRRGSRLLSSDSAGPLRVHRPPRSTAARAPRASSRLARGWTRIPLDARPSGSPMPQLPLVAVPPPARAPVAFQELLFERRANAVGAGQRGVVLSPTVGETRVRGGQLRCRPLLRVLARCLRFARSCSRVVRRAASTASRFSSSS